MGAAAPGGSRRIVEGKGGKGGKGALEVQKQDEAYCPEFMSKRPHQGSHTMPRMSVID